MLDSHILRLLEDKPLAGLGADESAAIEIHVALCSECRRAYDAARVSAALLRERAAERAEVPPFFKTRVMATIRERQLSPEGPVLLKMWGAARALVSTIAAAVVILIALTFLGQNGGPQVLSAEAADGVSIYSPEYVLLEEGNADGESLMYDQVLATMYDVGDADEQ